MYFDCVQILDGTSFKHKSSAKTFTYRRIVKSKYVLGPQLLEVNKKVGDATIVYQTDRFFMHNPLRASFNNPAYSEGAYGLRSINVSAPYRKNSLGTLLMFIATTEVQANNGKHLYILTPTEKAWGFYLQFGFHPDPKVVAAARLFRPDHVRSDDHTIMPSHVKSDDHLDAGFAKKNFFMGRNYLIWRGQVETALGLLISKVNSAFDFLPLI